MLGACGTLCVDKFVLLCRLCVCRGRVCSSELCSMGDEAHCNAGKEREMVREEWMREREGRERQSEQGMDGEKEKENREMLWSGTRCLVGIRSGPHEASLAHTLNKKPSIQQRMPLQDFTLLHSSVKIP